MAGRSEQDATRFRTFHGTFGVRSPASRAKHAVKFIAEERLCGAGAGQRGPLCGWCAGQSNAKKRGNNSAKHDGDSPRAKPMGPVAVLDVGRVRSGAGNADVSCNISSDAEADQSHENEIKSRKQPKGNGRIAPSWGGRSDAQTDCRSKRQ